MRWQPVESKTLSGAASTARRPARRHVVSIIFSFVSFSVISKPLLSQSQTPPSPVPRGSVAIENTNAGFAPTDISIPQANPARPTVTNPAHIPPVGYLQFEQGIGWAGKSPGGTVSQLAITQMTKIALTTRVLINSIVQPYAYSQLVSGLGPQTYSSDVGDLQLGAQVILHKSIGPLPTVAMSYTRRVRTGTAANIDAGEYSQQAVILLEGDLVGGLHYDLNLLADEQNDGPVRRPQFVEALAIGHTLFARSTKQLLSGTVELSHFNQPFITSTLSGSPVDRANAYDLLFVAAYAVRPNLVLDASVDRGLTSTSTHWQAGFGFTYLLPRRLWGDRHPVPIAVGHRSYPPLVKD